MTRKMGDEIPNLTIGIFYHLPTSFSTTSQENVDKNRFPVLPEPVEMLRIAMSSAGTKESPTSPKVDDRDV